MKSTLKVSLRKIPFQLSDGTRLCGQLWESPAAPSPSVLVVCRTCQPLSRLSAFAQALVELGYSAFLQSVRGCGESDGNFQPYTQEWKDGSETAAALLASAFLERRRLLLVGLGYDGQAALTAAIASPVEAVAGLAVTGVTESHFHSGLRQNGVWSGEELLRLTRFLPEEARPSREVFAAWLSNPRWAPGLSPFSSRPELEKWLFAARKAFTFRSFWRQQALCPRLYLREMPDVPAFIATGTAASTCNGAMELAHRLADRNASSVEIHLGDEDDSALEDYSPDSPPTRRLLEWLENFPMKQGRPGPEDQTVHCRIQSVDSEPPEWLAWRAWPALAVSATELYLSPAGKLSTLTPSGTASLEFLDTPQQPPPSPPGSWGFKPVSPRFGQYGLPLAARTDTLAFTSEPLPAELTLLGTPQLRLRVTSNRNDTQLLARLVVLGPSRNEQILTYGAGRLSLRYGAENLVAFNPNTDSSTTITFPLRHIACRLPAGTRLRLELASNDFPRYLLGTNQLPRPEQPGQSPRNARNSVEIDARGTSRLTIPVLNKDSPNSLREQTAQKTNI